MLFCGSHDGVGEHGEFRVVHVVSPGQDQTVLAAGADDAAQ